MADIKRIDIREFWERGYLQEVNRRFLHPLGLALEVVAPEPDAADQAWRLGGVWDARDDPEGVIFEGFSPEEVARAKAVDAELVAKRDARIAIFGGHSAIQPIERA